MSSVGRWVLTLIELETVVHGMSFQLQLERLLFLVWFGSSRVLA
jgi:hypothetical protein